jgi:hypothetical protein
MCACTARALDKFPAIKHQQRADQAFDVSRVVIENAREDGVAAHGEHVTVDGALALLIELISELVPPYLLVGQGLTGDHDGAGWIPHGRMLHIAWLRTRLAWISLVRM